MCKKEKVLFVDHSNTNPKTHLNRSKLNLNRNGYEKWGKNFVSFIRNNYAWLSVTSKKVYSDSYDSPTSTEVNNKLIDHTSNKDLQSLHIRNLNKIIVGLWILIPLEISSIFLLIKYKETLIYLWCQKQNLMKVSL